MSKGVVILALGDAYYGTWALNLAVSIKYSCPETNITLLWQGNGLLHISQHIHNFDKIVEVPKHITDRHGLQSLLRAKVCLYELSPYDETIFIDADVIWFPNKDKGINLVFESLKDVDFTMGCRSKNDLSNTDPRLIWCTVDEMKKTYGEVNIYNLSSEFIYFKKTERIKEFFEEAKKYFDEPNVEYVRFAGSVPDELAFQIAMIKTAVEPHKEKYLPFYWEQYEKQNKELQQLYKEDFYGYSIGGSTLLPMQVNVYNTLAKVYAANFGFKFPMLCKSKRELFTNRNTV